MASNMIHYAVSKRIAERIFVGDLERFYFGASILPDASSHNDGSYDRSHFKARTMDNSLKGIDWRRFEQKYGCKFDEDRIYLGYWCHLVEDAMWLHDVVDKYVRIYSRDIRGAYYQKGCADYIKLNYLLQKKYDLEVPSFSKLNVPIEEVREDMVLTMVNAFQGHFDAEECEKSNLELYSWNVIISYIEKCAEFCIHEIEAMRAGKERVEPQKFYVTP